MAKPNKLALAIRRINKGEYDIVGEIREGPRKAKGKEAKAQDAARLQANAVQRARYHFTDEGEKLAKDRLGKYHARTVVALLKGRKLNEVLDVAVKTKTVSRPKASKIKKAADVVSLLADKAAAGDLKAAQVRELLAPAKTVAKAKETQKPLAARPKVVKVKVKAKVRSGGTKRRVVVRKR